MSIFRRKKNKEVEPKKELIIDPFEQELGSLILIKPLDSISEDKTAGKQTLYDLIEKSWQYDGIDPQKLEPEDLKNIPKKITYQNPDEVAFLYREIAKTALIDISLLKAAEETEEILKPEKPRLEELKKEKQKYDQLANELSLKKEQLDKKEYERQQKEAVFPQKIAEELYKLEKNQVSYNFILEKLRIAGVEYDPEKVKDLIEGIRSQFITALEIYQALCPDATVYYAATLQDPDKALNHASSKYSKIIKESMKELK